MEKLQQGDLYTLEHYARIRKEFRDQVIEHKRDRRIALGEHASLYFEDRMTMQYQVQEMLRLERMFEPDLIQAELDVYNPLIPDGQNWKATFMIEYPDETERRAALAKLVGVESAVWMRVDGLDAIRPISNEDLSRSEEDKTSAVHFMRFELTPPMIAALKSGAGLQAGIDHPQCNVTVDVAESVRQSLTSDLA